MFKSFSQFILGSIRAKSLIPSLFLECKEYREMVMKKKTCSSSGATAAVGVQVVLSTTMLFNKEKRATAPSFPPSSIESTHIL